MPIEVLGIDLGTNSCSLVGLDASGAVIKRLRIRAENIPAFTKSMQPCVVAMEACCGAHHLGRLLAIQGHIVRLMSPEYVRPYVKAQKNDERDAEAIAKAASRPTMRFVVLKSEEQLDMQTLHRAHDRLVSERTALINQLRAVLLERGVTVAQGRRKLERHLAAMLDADADTTLSPRMCRLIEDKRADWLGLDQRIAAFDNEFAACARSDADAWRLATIPGIGLLNATALVAAIGKPSRVDAISQRGSGWCHVKPRPAGTPGWLASPNAATSICARAAHPRRQVTGDKKMQAEGKMDKAKGAARARPADAPNCC